jgi:hypothetical protein
MKKPLYEYEGKAQFTTNTLHESVGEVTVTMPAEVAAFLVGLMGQLRCSFTADGRVIEAFNGFYEPIWGYKGPIPNEVKSRLEPFRQIGNQIGGAASAKAKEYDGIELMRKLRETAT